MAGLFDEDLAHGLRGRAEEMAPAFPAGILIPHQAEIRLVDQGRRLKRLAGGQPGSQAPPARSAQLSVEIWQQFCGSGCFSWDGPLIISVGVIARNNFKWFLTLRRRRFQMVL